MATEELIVKLDARTAKLDAKLKATDEKLDRLSKTTKKSDNSLKSFGKTALATKGAVVGLAAALGVGAFTRFADQIQNAENQLKSVTSSTEEFNIVQDELRRIAIDTRQSLSELTSVYARFKRAGDEAGFTIQETIDLTESLTKAMKIEGSTTAEVNSVLLQLTQSFRSGRISGEEFRAVSEGSTIVLKALATQLGVTTGELKEMAAQGLVTPEALIQGLKGTEKEINRQFEDLEPTFAEVGTAMGRAFTAAYDDSIAESTSTGIKKMLIDMGADIEMFFSGEESLSEAGLEKRIEEVADKLLGLKKEAREWAEEDITSKFLDDRIAIQTDKLEKLQERLNAVQETEAIDIDVTGVEDPRIQREKDFALAVLEIHTEQAVTEEERFVREAEIHQLALDNKLISENEYQKAVNDSAKRYAIKKEKNDKKYYKIDEKNKRSNVGSMLSIADSLVGGNDKIGKAIFLATKALGISDVFVQTQRAAARALADLGPVAGAPVAASIQANGALSMAAIAASAIGGLSSGGGGGSVSTGNDSIGPQQKREPDFVPESSSLEFTDTTESGQATINLTVPDGDLIGEAIASWLSKAQSEGRV